MRIDPEDKIVNIPIVKVRDFMRYVGNENHWDKNFISSYLEITPKKAYDLIRALLERGYIEHVGFYKKRKMWRKTLKGSTFSLASAAKPVLRKTADSILAEFLARVQTVNSDSNFLVKVKKVLIFGSYLNQAPKINDIDIAVELVWKENHPKIKGKNKADVAVEHARNAAKKGRRFSTYLDELCWPDHEVKLFLKARSRTISLHTTEDKILDKVESKLYFSDE